MALNLNSAKEFFLKIEDIVNDTNMSYMDSVLYYCEQNEMEPETAATLITGKLKQNGVNRNGLFSKLNRQSKDGSDQTYC